MAQHIDCVIYRSPKKLDTYLFVLREDDFADVPDVLLKSFGKPEKVMELTLTPEKKLARDNVQTVMADLQQQGFHLQLPPTVMSDE